MKDGFVYIMASRRNGTLYIGVTSDLAKRVWEHKSRVIGGFTKRYACKMLVWFEAHEDLDGARRRELQMKEWRRAWKLRVIEEKNPTWNDLYDTLFYVPGGSPAEAGVQNGSRAALGAVVGV